MQNWRPTIMIDEYENLATDFAALVSNLEDVLSPSQVWELQIHIDYDEHELAFQMLCEMLRHADVTIPDPASELFVELASRLGVDDALWSDLRGAKERQ
jgi:hypothetical protein